MKAKLLISAAFSSLFVFIIPGGSVHAAAVLLSHTSSAGATSPAINTTGATLFVIQEVRYGLAPNAPTDSAGNAWTALSPHNDGTSYYAEYFYVCGPTTSANQTFTPGAFTTGSAVWMSIAAYSGTATSNCYDSGTDQSARTPSASASALPTITPSAMGDLIVSGVAENSFGADSPSVNQGLNIVETHSPNPDNAFAWTQYNSASPLTVSWTVNNSLDSEMIIAAFKPGAASAPPVISAVTASSITSSGATVSWTTDTNSNSQVDYGTTTAYGNSSSLNAALVTNHSISLSSLTAGTTYHYRVKSTDASGNLALSTDNTFTTTSAGGSGAASWTDLGAGSRLSLSSPQNCNNTTSPAYCNGIIYGYHDNFGSLLTAWGNAIARTKAGSEQLVFFGGGHTDYLGNDVHAINLYTAPVSASMLTAPSIPYGSGVPVTTSNLACQTPNPDGTPMSQHGYQNFTYLPKHDEIFFWGQGRSDWCLNSWSGTDRLAWTFRFSDNTWHNMAPGGFDVKAGTDIAFGSYVVLDPTTQDETALVMWGLGGVGELLRYDRDTNVWSQLMPAGSYNWPSGAYAAVDPVRKLLVIMGNSRYDGAGTLQAITIDISNSSYHATDISSSLSGCAAANVLNPGMAYDPNTGNMKIYPGSGNNVLDFNPATGVCTTLTASGGPTDTLPGAGQWGKWQYFPTLNAFVNATQVTSDAFMFKTSGGSQPPPADTTAPTVPANLSAAAISASAINLSWTASTDNVGVTGYKIYRGGVQIGTSATNSYSDTGLAASTNYSYSVSAYDAAGNNSSQSSAASATTQASSGGTGANLNGLGGSTMTCVDLDADGYGTGEGCLGPDADDKDPTLHTGAQAIAKYGSLNAFLNHLGYFPTRIWYVSPTGNDATCISGGGPVGINLPCATIGPAQLNLQPGDAVIFRGGTYPITYPSIISPDVNGTSAHPIIFMGYPGELPVLDSTANGFPEFALVDRSWITVDGFKLTGSGSGCIDGGDGQYGAPTNTFHDIAIRHVETTHCFWGMITGGMDNLLIEDSSFHDTLYGGQHGIYLGAKGNQLSSNDTVRRVLLYNNDWNGIHINGNITNLLLEQTISYGNGIAGLSFQNGTHNSIIRNNLAFSDGSNGGGEPMEMNNYDGTEGASGCASEADGICKCLPTASVEGLCAHNQNNNIIENNTFVGTEYGEDTSRAGSVGLLISEACTQPGCLATNNGYNTFRNDIFVTYTNGSNHYQGIVFSSSTEFSTSNFSNIISWQSDPAHSPGVVGVGYYPSSYGFQPYTCASWASTFHNITGTCLNADPKFTSVDPTAQVPFTGFNFSLQPSSPAIGAGTVLGASTYDIIGNTFNNPPSLGAYEFGSGGGGGGTGSAPSISSFSASPGGITLGQSATLSWNVSGATSLSIDNGVGSQSNLSNGSVSVSPSGTTTYTLTATNANGSQTAFTTVTINLAPDTTNPTVSLTSPSAGTVSGNITFSATASDPVIANQVTSGLKTVTLYVDGSLFASSTTASVSRVLDTTTLTNGSHTLIAQSLDNAGNLSAVASVTITVNNISAQKFPRLITLTSLEGLLSIPSGEQITATVVSPSNGSTLETESNLSPNASKQYTVTFQASDPQLVNIRIKATGYLSRLLQNIDTTVNSASALSVSQLLAGDLNSDNIVNTLDYSSMNTNWLKPIVTGDINADGLINSLDFAILKNNWGKGGE